MTTLSHRERVLTALRHQPPDRPPIDLSGHRSSGISAVAYAKFRQHLGLPPKPIRVYDPVQQLAVGDEDVLDRFGVDTIELGRGFALADDCWADWVLPDGTPCQMPKWALPVRDGKRWVLHSQTGRVIAEMPDGALYFEQTHYPFFDGPPDHEHFFTEYKRCDLAKPRIQVQVQKDYRVTLRTDKPAFFVSLNATGIRGEFDDNCVALLPGKAQTFKFTPKQPVTLAAFKKSLTLNHLRGTYA